MAVTWGIAEGYDRGIMVGALTYSVFLSHSLWLSPGVIFSGKRFGAPVEFSKKIFAHLGPEAFLL